MHDHLQTLLAATPIAVALLLLAARAGPVWAGLGALASAAAATWLGFPTPVRELRAGVGDIAALSVEVVLILLGGILLNELLAARGVQRRFGEWVTDVSGGSSRALLLVVLGVTPFVEAVTGFGVGAVVAIPLLLHLGFSPYRSAVAGLLGLVIVPWGALAPGTLVAARLADLSFQQLGVRSALLSLPVFVIAGGAALVVGLGRRRALQASGELAVVAGSLWAGVLAVNVVVGTAVAGALGSLVGIGAALALARLREGALLAPPRDLGRKLLPYATLVGGLLAARAATTVAEAGGLWASVVNSPATWLLLTCVAVPFLVPNASADDRTALRGALLRWWPVALTTASFLAVGGVMTATGMSRTLAHTAAELGPAYPALAPWIGALGGFLTGSNAGANAMFAASQAETARAIGYPVLTLVAVQNVSASLATMVSIPRVALAVSLAPSARLSAGSSSVVREVRTGIVLRTVLGVVLAVLAVLSLLALLPVIG